MSKLIIGGREFNSRLFVGTGKFSSNDLMQQAILASESEMVTVAMKRVDMEAPQKDGHSFPHTQRQHTTVAQHIGCTRCRRSRSRRTTRTGSIRNQLHQAGNPPRLPNTCLPDPVETLKATEELVKMGFVVLPYIQADPSTVQTARRSRCCNCHAFGCPYRNK